VYFYPVLDEFTSLAAAAATRASRLPKKNQYRRFVARLPLDVLRTLRIR
jgi:hypothetical protein